MKTYLKNFFKVHISCWYMHLATLFLMPVTFFITIIVGQGYDYYYGDSNMFYALCSITFAVLATPLLIWPNYKATKNCRKASSCMKIIALTMVSQLFFILVFYFIGYVAMTLLII